MKQCSSCNTMNSDSSRFCCNCGSELTVNNNISTENPYLDKIDDTAPIITEKKAQKPNWIVKHKKLLIILSALVVFAFIVNGVLLKITFWSVNENIKTLLNKTVTVEDYDDCNSIYNLYNSFSDKHKEKIENYSEFTWVFAECIQLKNIEDFNLLYSQGDYEEALEKFDSVTTEVDSYKTVCDKVYNSGIDLLYLKEYTLCKQYFDFFDEEYKDSDKYVDLLDLILSSENGEDINYLEATGKLKNYSEDGLKIADEFLKQKPFSDYLDFINHGGLYKSDKSFTYKDKFFKYDECAYIYLGISLDSASYWTDPIKNITASDVIHKALQNDFSCDCAFVGNGKYHCIAHYKDAISKENAQYSFDLSFSGDKLVISSLKTTEDKDSRTFIDGTYSKVG